jgi:hypothetical protein
MAHQSEKLTDTEVETLSDFNEWGRGDFIMHALLWACTSCHSWLRKGMWGCHCAFA